MKKALSLVICLLMIVSTILPLSASGANNSTYNVTKTVVNKDLNSTATKPVVSEVSGKKASSFSAEINPADAAYSYSEISALNNEKTAKITCSVSQNEVYRGDTVTVNVSLSDCDMIKAIQIDLSVINQDVFEIMSVNAGEMFTGGMGRYNQQTHKFNYAFFDNTEISGNIFTFTLKVNANAELGCISVDVGSIIKVMSTDGINEFNIDTINIPTKLIITCNHDWMEKSSVAPTCISEGHVNYTCSICGAEKVEAIPTDPNAHNWKYSHDVDYTCTEDGYSVYECTLCGSEKKSDFVPAAHTYEDTVFDASPAAKRGFTLHTCIVCGYSYKDNFTFYEENIHAKAYVETVYASAGDEVEVSVIVENAGDLKMLSIKDLSYDESRLELVKAEWKVKGILSDWDKDNRSGVCAFGANTPIDGAVFTFTFKLSNDDLDYETPVSCTLCARTKPAGGIETDVEIDNYSGKVWVSVHGDVSGDNVVDSDDAIYFLKHVADEENYDYELNQPGDFNGDGYVDSDDAIYLLYHTLLPERFPLK